MKVLFAKKIKSEIISALGHITAVSAPTHVSASLTTGWTLLWKIFQSHLLHLSHVSRVKVKKIPLEKVCPNLVLNLQPPDDQSDILTNELPGLALGPFPKMTKFWMWPNWKHLQTPDDKLNIAKIMIPLFDRGENIVGKGENAGHQHFLLFPHFFPKPSSLGSLEVGIACYRVNRWIQVISTDESLWNYINFLFFLTFFPVLLFPQCFLRIHKFRL